MLFVWGDFRRFGDVSEPFGAYLGLGNMVSGWAWQNLDAHGWYERAKELVADDYFYQERVAYARPQAV